MERYTLQERIEIIKIHYKNGDHLAETVRETRTFLSRREAPCQTAIKKLVKKFELLEQVSDVKNKTRAHRSRTAENIAAVARNGATVTVNGLRYGEMKSDSFDLDIVYFQQDGNTCHTSNETIDLSREKFSDHVISGIGDHD